MTAILIRAPDGDWLTREHTHSEVLLFMALGYQPQDASERLARFASGQAVPVGDFTWEIRRARQKNPTRRHRGTKTETKMKTTLTITAAIIGGLMLPLTAFAGPFGLPDHQPDGYRDTGCDPAKQVQITNDAGKYLYSNNPTCPMPTGPSAVEAVAPVGPVDPVDPGDDTTEAPAPVKPPKPGHGWGDGNHDHSGPPGKNKKV